MRRCGSLGPVLTNRRLFGKHSLGSSCHTRGGTLVTHPPRPLALQDAPLLVNPWPSWHKYSWMAEFVRQIPNAQEKNDRYFKRPP